MRLSHTIRTLVLVPLLLAACSESNAPTGVNRMPTANAGGPYTGAPGVPMIFSAAGSADPDGSISGYLWDFGDGTTSTSANPSKTYSAAGSYSATLTVTDDSGATASDQASVGISVVTGPTPPAITYSTFFGGSSDEMIRDVTTDNAGNVYLVGGSDSPNFPVTIGSAQGDYDVIVVKLSASGQLIWSRRFGGTGYDRAYGVEIDAQGEIVLGGRASAGFPVTPGAFQTVFAGGVATNPNSYGDQDGFICKLNSSTAATIWCSYLGANDGGAIRDVDVDASGNVFAASWVSANYPANWFKPVVYQRNRAGGQDLSITKVSADGSQVLFCTYLGGTQMDGDGPSVRVLPNGDAAFVMTESSTDIPTVNAAQPSYQGGSNDLFVGVIASDGSTLRWGSYLGGNGNDNTETHDLAIDSHGNVIVAASTNSADLPLVGPQLRTGFGGGSDAFFARYSPTGTMLNSTYFGGSSGDSFQGITVGPGDTVYASGSTKSTSLPGVTGTLGGGGSDIYTIKVSADFSQNYGGVRLGGSQDDEGRSIARGPSGTWYVGGITRSTNFPAVNAGGASYGGGGEDGIFVIITP